MIDWSHVYKVLVKQRQTNDCTVAAVAMLTGQSYESTFSRLLELMAPADVLLFHQCHGIHLKYAVVLADSYGITLRTCDASTADWSCKSLIVVPSLNSANSTHVMFYDGRYIIDPNLDRVPRMWYCPNGLRDLRLRHEISHVLQ